MVKLILADNQAIFRAGAAKVLAVEDDLRVVAQAESAEKANAAMERFRPALLICAASLHANPAEIINLARQSKTRVIMVAESGDNPQGFITMGAAGVVGRNVSSSELLECVRAVLAGKTWIRDGAPQELTDTDMVGQRVRDRLTPKELKIVALIVQGFKNKEIATSLGTTEQVIKNYLRNVYDKIGVSDRLELALFTIHHRILAEAAAAVVAGGDTQTRVQ